jgi:sulfide:quinone oxidoreductase
VRRKFDMIHVTPPQEPPEIIRGSRLADRNGWIAVDPGTLRHVRYANVFGLGDAIGTGNAKTVAAIRMQVPVVARNLLALLDGKPMPARYDGYTACPIATSLGRVMLAEFRYGGAVTSSLLRDPRVPRRVAWWTATRLPRLYWDKMLRGKRPALRHGRRTLSGAA